MVFIVVDVHLLMFSNLFITISTFLYLESWKCPLQKGDNIRPPPLGGHRIAKFDSYRAVLFGGKKPPPEPRKDPELSNEVWILDLVNMVREHIFGLHFINKCNKFILYIVYLSIYLSIYIIIIYIYAAK